jgi:RNA polymerase II C-terminal domain phosphatase-like 1/2
MDMISDRFVTCLFDASDSYGEVVLTPQTADAYLSHAFGKEIRFLSFSASSDRCSPLLVLHTIGSGVLFKLAPSQRQLATDTRRLNSLHSSCLTESKTAVVPLEGGVEIHLVAMPVAQTQLENGGANACFWGFLVEEAMYASCLPLLNLRCLAMVLDLDETLIVANTMKTFDDRIDALTRRLQAGRDDSGQLLASLKRFQEDKAILEQYYKTDQVFNNGKLYKAQSEVVAPVVEGGMQITRPIIRLLEHNLILTRINPTVRDTSVLVRMRPAWDDLRNYLMAKKGRRRFEVFICTMSERDYALEMWRLLDPDARLINSVELNERVNCVKSDAKKSLKQVFPHHFCHPKMAMVIDDRLAVWEKPDQPRVHQVQAFQPYTTDPITETICDPPPLCIARNIACNVRAGFFKDLDEILTHQMADIRFDTDVTTLPNAPDVCNYMLPESVMLDEVVPGFGTISAKRCANDGVAALELAQLKMKQQETNGLACGQPYDEDLRSPLQLPTKGASLVPASLTSWPSLDPQDIVQHDGETSSYSKPGDDALYSFHPTFQRPLASTIIQGSVAREEGEVPETDIDPDTRRRLLILQHGQDNLQKHRPQEEMFFEENRPGPDASVFSDDEDVGRPIQVNPPREHSFHASLLGANANNAVSTLHEFGQKVNAMVQYRTKLRTSSQLGFNVEIMFNGEKVGEGTGGTKKEANTMAAKDALNFLANESTNGRRVEPLSNSYSGPGDYGQPLHGRSLRDPRLRVGLEPVAMDDDTRSVASTSGHVRLGDNRSDVDDQTFNVVSALKELCTTEGINVQFRAMPSSGLGNHQAFHCHVDVAGRTLGKGSGVTWEAAKHQAAEEALGLLQTSVRFRKAGIGPKSPRRQAHKRLRGGDVRRDQGAPFSPARSIRSRVSGRRRPKNLASIS